MRKARNGRDGWRVVGAVAAWLLLGATACGDDGSGPGPGVGSAGPVVLADPGAGELVVVAPDGGDRRTVESGSVLADGPRLVTVGVAGTAVAGDDEGALYLVRAGEARAVDLGARIAGGGPPLSGPVVADGGGRRFALVASARGGDPVLIDAEEGTATVLSDLLGLRQPLFASRFSPDERHLAVLSTEGLHLVATEGAVDLGLVADAGPGAFTPDGATLWTTRPASGSGGDGESAGGPVEVVRIPVDDPAAVEVVTAGDGIVMLAAFDGSALGQQDGQLMLIEDGTARPVDVGGEVDGPGLTGAGAAVVRVDRGGEVAWVRVDANGEVEELPELAGMLAVGGGPGVVVLSDGRPGDRFTALGTLRLAGDGVEAAVTPVELPEGAAMTPTFVPSPDGRAVAGTIFQDDVTRTFVVDITGGAEGGELQLMDGGFGAWSPAGDEVVVGRWQETGKGAGPVAVIVAPGGDETELGPGQPVAWTTG